jgi:hypothetical protein
VLPYEDIIPYHLTFSEKLICKKLFFWFQAQQKDFALFVKNHQHLQKKDFFSYAKIHLEN